MAAKNGCNEAAQLLLAHGAFVEAKANVNFLVTSFVIQYSTLNLRKHCLNALYEGFFSAYSCRMV